LGLDLSLLLFLNATFHVIGLNARGEIVLRKKFSLKQLLVFTANRQQILIGTEACGDAQYLARALREQDHDVRLMPAQDVKPYIKTNRDRPEAEHRVAVCVSQWETKTCKDDDRKEYRTR
jgi:transposase